MYITNGNYITAISSPSRNILSKVEIGSDTIFDMNDIIDFSIEYTLGNGNVPIIGGVGSANFSLNLVLNTNTNITYKAKVIKPYVGIYVSSTETYWIPLGVFYAKDDNITKTKTTISISCFDIMQLYTNIAFESSLSYPTSMKLLCEEIEATTNLTFENLDSFSTIVINNNPSGKPIRNILSSLATISSTNCIINRLGNVDFISYTDVDCSIDENNYFKFDKKSDALIKLSKLICISKELEEPIEIEYGTNDGISIKIEDENISTQAELITIYNKTFPLQYQPYIVQCIGLPHIDIGDVIAFKTINNETFELPIVRHMLTFNNGLQSEFSAECPSKESTDIGSLGNSFFDVINKSFNAKIDNVNKTTTEKINHATKEITENFDTLVTTTSDGILSQVSQEHYEKSVIDSLLQKLSTQIVQNSADITFNFTSLTEYATTINDETKAQIEEFRKYIRFSDEGIEIGEENSNFLSKFSNTELGFYYGTNRIAYISNDRLFIPASIEVGENLTVGNETNKFTWRVRDNGHFTLRVGD